MNQSEEQPKAASKNKCSLCGRSDKVEFRIYGQNSLDDKEEVHYIEFEIPDYSIPGNMERFFLSMIQTYCTAWNYKTNEYTIDANQLCELWDIDPKTINDIV